MRQFNYKCLVSKNGSKKYYQRVGGKWKRITNKMGMKAQKGKRVYKTEFWEKSDEERIDSMVRDFKDLQDKKIREKMEREKAEKIEREIERIWAENEENVEDRKHIDSMVRDFKDLQDKKISEYLKNIKTLK